MKKKASSSQSVPNSDFNKKVLIPTILLVGVMIFAFWALPQEKENALKKDETAKKTDDATQIKTQDNQKKEDNDNTKNHNTIVLFYGDGCPHCKIVEEYIEKNKVKDKLSFEEKEVYHDKNNGKDLEEKAKICGLSDNSIGVPLLWTEEKCLIGDKDIIEFFKEKIK